MPKIFLNLFVDFIRFLSAVFLWFLLFIHRHFDSTLKRHDSLFDLFSVKIEVSILTEEGVLIDKR